MTLTRYGYGSERSGMSIIRQAAMQKIDEQIAEIAKAKGVELRDRIWDDGRDSSRETHTISMYSANGAAQVAIPDMWLFDYLTFSTFAVLRLRDAIDRLAAAEGVTGKGRTATH